MSQPILTGVERYFSEDDIIVSKTNNKGHIIYANPVFREIADYSEAEIQNKPHNMIRHPNMPRCIFKLLWDTISTGQEIFAYVINRSRNGDHYWVLAHVTPDFGTDGNIVGYHSSRRVPRKDAVATIEPLYKQLLDIEAKHVSPKDGIHTSSDMLADILNSKGVRYDQFVLAV